MRRTNDYLSQLLTSQQTSLLRTIRQDINKEGPRERVTVHQTNDSLNNSFHTSTHTSRVHPAKDLDKLQNIFRNSRINSKFNDKHEIIIQDAQIHSNQNCFKCADYTVLIRELFHQLVKKRIILIPANKDYSLVEISNILQLFIKNQKKLLSSQPVHSTVNQQANKEQFQKHSKKGLTQKMMSRINFKQKTQESQSMKIGQQQTELFHLKLLNHIKDEQIRQMKKVIQNLQNKMNVENNSALLRHSEQNDF